MEYTIQCMDYHVCNDHASIVHIDMVSVSRVQLVVYYCMFCVVIGNIGQWQAVQHVLLG